MRQGGLKTDFIWMFAWHAFWFFGSVPHNSCSSWWNRFLFIDSLNHTSLQSPIPPPSFFHPISLWQTLQLLVGGGGDGNDSGDHFSRLPTIRAPFRFAIVLREWPGTARDLMRLPMVFCVWLPKRDETSGEWVVLRWWSWWRVGICTKSPVAHAAARSGLNVCKRGSCLEIRAEMWVTIWWEATAATKRGIFPFKFIQECHYLFTVIRVFALTNILEIVMSKCRCRCSVQNRERVLIMRTSWSTFEVDGDSIIVG